MFVQVKGAQIAILLEACAFSKQPEKCFTYFWFPVENREEPIKSVLCVCPCVRHRLSQKPPEDFSETWHEVGDRNVRNVHVFFISMGPT